MALGFEKMSPGSLGSVYKDRVPPMVAWGLATREFDEAAQVESKGPAAARMFGNGAKEYFDKYGATTEHLAKIG
jgi:sterol carrier protein 2